MTDEARDVLMNGQTYRNKRGDLRGPMRFVRQRGSSGWFVDQHGVQFYPDGTEANHTPDSTANIDLSTAGAQSAGEEG